MVLAGHSGRSGDTIKTTNAKTKTPPASTRHQQRRMICDCPAPGSSSGTQQRIIRRDEPLRRDHAGFHAVGEQRNPRRDQHEPGKFARNGGLESEFPFQPRRAFNQNETPRTKPAAARSSQSRFQPNLPWAVRRSHEIRLSKFANIGAMRKCGRIVSAC